MNNLPAGIHCANCGTPADDQPPCCWFRFMRNRRVYQYAHNSPEIAGMSTSQLVAFDYLCRVCCGGSLELAHINYPRIPLELRVRVGL